MKKCNFCHQNIQALKSHVQECQNAKSLLIKTNKLSLQFSNGLYLCLRCDIISNTYDDHVSHRKSCKKSSQKTSSSKKDSSIDLDNYLIEKEIPQQKTHKKIKPNQIQTIKQDIWDIKNQVLSYNQAKMIIPIELWCNKNKIIPKNALIKIFDDYLDKSISLLSIQVPFVQIKTLYQIQKNIKWQEFIKCSQQIFCKQLIIEKTKSKTQKQKIKIYSALNRIYSRYGKCFQRFQLPTIEYLSQRATKPIKFKDFMCVIEKLINQKTKGYVHIAIQLLIIMLSRQRFPSMLKLVQQCMRNILQLRKKDKNITSFRIIAKKTNSKQELILPKQLLEIIQLAQWSKFSQKLRFYHRLGDILPFTCYSLRKGFFSFLYLSIPINQGLNTLTGHKKAKNLQYYIRQQQRAVYIQVINREFFLPFIRKFDNIIDQKPTFLEKFNQNQLKSVVFPQQWFQCFLLKTRQIINQDPLDILNNQFKQPLFQIQELIPEKSGFEIKQEQVIEQINIGKIKIKLRNKVIVQNQLYFPFQNGQCAVCQGNIECGSQCRFCQTSYHQDCSPFLCMCFEKNMQFQSIFGEILISKKGKTHIKMPEKYFNKKIQDQDQIRAIIHLRGFRYTSCATMTPKASNFIRNNMNKFNFQPLDTLKLNRYYQYLQYEYFPPIRFGIYGDQNQNGCGFGLYATQEIDKHTFLGQYAADLFLRTQTYEVDRKDCILSFIQDQRRSHSLDLGPIRYFGYVLLINSSNKPNCAFKKCVVNERPAVIAYTLKKILPYQQLLIDYQLKTQVIFDNQEQIQLISQRTITSTQDFIGVKNIGNTCYISAALQLLKKIVPLFFLQQNANPVQKQINNFLKEKNIYDPSNLTKIMINSSNSFMPNRQGDSTQAFLFLINEIYQDLDIENRLQFQSFKKIKCLLCTSQSTLKQKQMTIHLNSNIIKTQTAQLILDYDCSICRKKTKAEIKQKYQEFNTFCLFTFKKYGQNNQKLQYNCRTAEQIQLAGKIYKKVFYILHLGQSMLKGHYIAIDIENRVMYDDEKIQTKQYTINSKDIYLVAYKAID